MSTFKSSKTFVRLTGKSKQCNAQKRHLRAFGGRINVHLTCKKFCWKVINLLCRLCLQFISFSRQPQQLLLQEINNVSPKRHLSKACFPLREFCISSGEGRVAKKVLCFYHPSRVCARLLGSGFAPDSAPLPVLMKAPRKINLSIADFIRSLENLATLNGQLTLKPKQERSISCFTGLVLKFASNLLTWNYIANIFVLLIAAAVPSARRLSHDFPAWRRTDCVCRVYKCKKKNADPTQKSPTSPCLVCLSAAMTMPPPPPPSNPTCCWEIQCSSHKESCPLFQMYFVTSALHQRAAKTRVGGRLTCRFVFPALLMLLC